MTNETPSNPQDYAAELLREIRVLSNRVDRVRNWLSWTWYTIVFLFVLALIHIDGPQHVVAYIAGTASITSGGPPEPIPVTIVPATPPQQ